MPGIQYKIVAEFLNWLEGNGLTIVDPAGRKIPRIEIELAYFPGVRDE